jgi:hypothetical protein
MATPFSFPTDGSILVLLGVHAIRAEPPIRCGFSRMTKAV